MKLKKYLSLFGLKQNEFLDRVFKITGKKIPQSTLAKWISGIRVPRKEEILIIKEATEGLVEPNDFFD
jgi:hypothetical protein